MPVKKQGKIRIYPSLTLLLPVPKHNFYARNTSPKSILNLFIILTTINKQIYTITRNYNLSFLCGSSVYVYVCDYMSTAQERKFHYDQNQYSLDPLKLEQEYKPYSTNFKIGITIFTMQYKKGLYIHEHKAIFSADIT